MMQIHDQYGRIDETPFVPLSRFDATFLLDEFTRSLLEDEVRACGRFWRLERSKAFDESALGIGEKRIREFLLLKQRRVRYDEHTVDGRAAGIK